MRHLTIDGRTVPTQAGRDLRQQNRSLPEPEQGSPLVKTKVAESVGGHAHSYAKYLEGGVSRFNVERAPPVSMQ